MLSIKKAQKIGFNRCVDMIGREFVKKYKETACAWYETSGNEISVGVGVTDEAFSSKIVRLSEKPYKYRAIVAVNRNTGVIEEKECIIPGGTGA